MNTDVTEIQEWVKSIDSVRFSRDLRNLLLEFAALNTKAINSDINDLYVQLICFLDVLDHISDERALAIKKVNHKKRRTKASLM